MQSEKAGRSCLPIDIVVPSVRSQSIIIFSFASTRSKDDDADGDNDTISLPCDIMPILCDGSLKGAALITLRKIP